MKFLETYDNKFIVCSKKKHTTSFIQYLLYEVNYEIRKHRFY